MSIFNLCGHRAAIRAALDQPQAAAAEQTNKQSSTVSTASEELRASINEISRQIAEASRVIGSAVEEAQHSEQMVGSLIDSATNQALSS